MHLLISKNTAVAASKTKALPVKRKKPRAQSGVIPYRLRNGSVEIMLVTSSHSGKWGIPKGGLEDDMTKKESAANEAFEEAGIIGKAKKKLGEYEYVKGSTRRRQTVVVYSLKVSKVLADWDEGHRRERKWFSIEEATDKLHSRFKPFLKKIIKIANS